MRWISELILGGLLMAACGDRELDLAKQVIVAEEREDAARRELVRLERELANLPAGASKAELEKQIDAQRKEVLAAEVAARSLRIKSKQ